MKKLSYDDVKQIAPNLFINTHESVRKSIRLITASNQIIKWQNETRRILDNNLQNPDWADIGVILDDPYVVVIRDLVKFPKGSNGGYIRLYNRAYLEGGAAGVVILPEKDGELLLMHNFRHATRSWHWEIPRGFGEAGITAEEQARAELKEEIEADATELIDLGLMFSNTGLEGNPINLFLAHISTEGIINHKIGVDEIRWLSVLELEKWIVSNKVTDGFTITAYTRAKLKGLI